MQRLFVNCVSVGLVLSGIIAAQPSTANAAAVATSSPYATRAAEEVLKKGGNAFDAACAAVFVQGVAQSYFTGLGGGGFAVIDHGGKQAFYDFREQAPASTTSKLFAAIDPKADNAWTQQNTGGHSVGIPGNVAGCGMLNQKYGKLKWGELLQPAIQLAKNGFEVSQMYSEELGDQWKRLTPFKLTQSIFKGAEGKGVKKGEVVKQLVLAKTLEALAKGGYESFYKGKLAQAWTHEAKTLKVKVTPADLQGYRVKERAPIHFQFGKLEGVTAAPPSGAGYMVAGALRFIDHFQSQYGVPDKSSATRYVTDLEAFAYFGDLRDDNVADPSKTKRSPAKFIGSEAEQRAWVEIETRILDRLSKIGVKLEKLASKTDSPKFTRKLSNQGAKGNRGKTPSHTSNISVVDDSGNLVALTSSLGNIYGSGITVPKFGFLLSSTMGDFDLQAGKLNSAAAGRRPKSNMSPTILYENKTPVAALGAAGGALIPMSLVQFIQNYYIHGMDGKEAIKFPRASIDGNSVELEESAGEALLKQLKAMGYDANPTKTIWAVFNGTVRKDAQGAWDAVTEPRYDGEAWAGPVK